MKDRARNYDTNFNQNTFVEMKEKIEKTYTIWEDLDRTGGIILSSADKKDVNNGFVKIDEVSFCGKLYELNFLRNSNENWDLVEACLINKI